MPYKYAGEINSRLWRGCTNVQRQVTRTTEFCTVASNMAAPPELTDKRRPEALGEFLLYDGESIIIRNAVAFVFLLAALSFSRASLGVVFFLSQLCRFEVARSVSLSQL